MPWQFDIRTGQRVWVEPRAIPGSDALLRQLFHLDPQAVEAQVAAQESQVLHPDYWQQFGEANRTVLNHSGMSDVDTHRYEPWMRSNPGVEPYTTGVHIRPMMQLHPSPHQLEEQGINPYSWEDTSYTQFPAAAYQRRLKAALPDLAETAFLDYPAASRNHLIDALVRQAGLLPGTAQRISDISGEVRPNFQAGTWIDNPILDHFGVYLDGPTNIGKMEAERLVSHSMVNILQHRLLHSDPETAAAFELGADFPASHIAPEDIYNSAAHGLSPDLRAGLAAANAETGFLGSAGIGELGAMLPGLIALPAAHAYQRAGLPLGNIIGPAGTGAGLGSFLGPEGALAGALAGGIYGLTKQMLHG